MIIDTPALVGWLKQEQPPSLVAQL